jgi:hypothetical protein
VKQGGSNFTVHGSPSGDTYGGSFEYTDPAPLIAPVQDLKKSKSIGILDLSIFWLVVNFLVFILIALPIVGRN